MIYKRMAARLKGQDWLAIAIELAIVVVGVFIGTQVSNWNQTRVGLGRYPEQHSRTPGAGRLT